MADNNIPGPLNNQVIDFLKNKGQDMVEHFQKMQDDLSRKEFVGRAGVDDEDGFYVILAMDGLSKIKKVKIGKGALESGEKVLSDLLISAFNDLMEKYKSGVQNEVMGVYKKSGLPLSDEDKSDD